MPKAEPLFDEAEDRFHDVLAAGKDLVSLLGSRLPTHPFTEPGRLRNPAPRGGLMPTVLVLVDGHVTVDGEGCLAGRGWSPERSRRRPRSSWVSRPGSLPSPPASAVRVAGGLVADPRREQNVVLIVATISWQL